MIKLKSKGQVQPSQDNRDNMVKKLEKSSNSTIFAPQQDQAKEESLVQVKRSNMESKNKTKLSRKKSNVQELGCASDAKKWVTSFQHAPFNKMRSGRSDRLGPRKPNLTPTRASKMKIQG